MSDKPTMGEQYATAVASGRAADVILAAGLASQADGVRGLMLTRGLALHLWRMRHLGDVTGFPAVVAVIDDWLYAKARRERFKTGFERSPELVVAPALTWWLDSTCRPCEGRGHPLIPGTPVIDDSRRCNHCDGTGHAPLEHEVRSEYHYAAKAVVNELDRICSDVFGNMRSHMRSGV
jgi:hypothetical protein